MDLLTLALLKKNSGGGGGGKQKYPIHISASADEGISIEEYLTSGKFKDKLIRLRYVLGGNREDETTYVRADETWVFAVTDVEYDEESEKYTLKG